MQLEIPQEFKDCAERLLGGVRYGRFIEALKEPPSVTVRLNAAKAARAGMERDLLKDYDAPVPWAPDEGFYLKERPQFTFDPLFHAGTYYVQDASSMFLGTVLRHLTEEPVTVLDLCAAPGGKSTHIRSVLPEHSLLVSNEPIKARAQALVENMTKWGHPDVVVTNSYPDEFAKLPDFFDVLVTDVPCSGEGMFRKEEDAVRGWSMDNVMMCRDRQRSILQDVWGTLKPGGLLVYSTCTLNPYENEENVDWIVRELGASVVPVPVDGTWGVTGGQGSDGTLSVISSGGVASSCHFVPGLIRGEGFFLAVLRKDGGGTGTAVLGEAREKARFKKKKASRIVPELPDGCKSWMLHSETYGFREEGGIWIGMHSEHMGRLEQLRGAVKVLHAGVPMAVQKGKDWAPAHGLAMSVELNTSAFPVVRIAYGDAVAYLRKEVLVLPPNTPKGYVLLVFQDVPLGFVKNIGGRANNLYPQEWKIRTTHLSAYSLKSSGA